MKYLVAAMMLLTACAPAFAEEHCDKSETVVVGDKRVTVKDPLELLRLARNGGAKKTSTDYYFGCPAVLETLASDNEMDCKEFLTYTGILQDFNNAFSALQTQLPAHEAERIYNILLLQVIENVVDQILAPRSPA